MIVEEDDINSTMRQLNPNEGPNIDTGHKLINKSGENYAMSAFDDTG
jgi:hypothetical protein